MEEDLRRQCAELEQKLRQDDLSLQNETLEVQLVQMQDDFESLKQDFTSMCGFLQQQLKEKEDQLEEQTRAASSAEGHADCLCDLLHFHEENGQLISSYWRAQCEKRDGSIKFLSLKLQEYTVPSSEYWACRRASVDPGSFSPDLQSTLGLPASPATSSSAPAEPHSPRRFGASPPLSPRASGESGGAQAPSTGQSYQTLLDQHHELCREHQEVEDESLALERELEASELNCAALEGRLRHVRNVQRSQADNVSDDNQAAALEAECARLRSETEACEQALAAAHDRATASGQRGRLPAWAHRCVWRDELDVRAGQLERISLQFDATKRSLDAANEELQWQATSAEALRMRLADVLRSIQNEEAKTSDLREEHQQCQSEVEELLSRWPPREMAPLGTGGGPAEVEGAQTLPIVCQQAHWLLETIRRGSSSRVAAASEATQATQAAAALASASRLPEEAQAGAVRLTLL